MTNDILSVHPSGWRIAKLRELVSPIRPRVKPSDFPNLRFIGLENLQAHTTRLLGTESSATVRSSSIHFLPSDLLYSRLRPYLNKVMVADFEGLCSAEFIVLPSNDNINSKYLMYFLNSSVFVRFANSLNTGDRPRVDFTQIGEFVIPTPSIHEQKQIVAEIETQFARLDAAVAALKSARIRLKRYRASVLKAACEGRLVPTEAELARRDGREYELASVLLERIQAERAATPGKKRGKVKDSVAVDTAGLPVLSEGWAWSPLYRLLIRSEYGTSTKCDYDFTGPPVLRIPNVIKGKIDISDIKYASESLKLSDDDRLAKGDMLICRTNGSISLVGRSAVIGEDLHANYSFASYLLRLRFIETETVPLWVQSYLGSQSARQWIESRAASSAGQNNVSLSLMHSMEIPIPPLSEQKRIVAEVERRMSVIEVMEVLVEKNLKRAETLRQSILRMAFSGKLLKEPLKMIEREIEALKGLSKPAMVSPSSAARGDSSLRSE